MLDTVWNGCYREWSGTDASIGTQVSWENKPLKIAVWHNLPSGGGKRALYDQVRGLVSRGHEVIAWCPPTANQTFLPLSGLIKEHVVPFDWKYQVKRGPIGRRLQTYTNLLSQLAAMDLHCQECAKQINQGEFDVLLAHPCQMLRVTSLARYIKCPKLIYLQEPNRSMYEAMPDLHWVAPRDPYPGISKLRQLKRFAWNSIELQKNRIQARQERVDLGAYEQILVNSSFSRESVLRAYGLDSKVCYLGVDTEAFQPTEAPKQRYVIGLGNIYGNKGIETAVRAIGAIEASRRPELVWVGNFADDSYSQKIKELTAKLSVVFRPEINVTDAELINLLGRAAVMIYTSYLEPFGYAPLEAGACGTPVVAVAEGGVRESIRDGCNGILVGDSDVNALGEALLGFCDNLDRSREMGLSARKHVVEHWGLDVSIDRLERRLLEFINTHNTARAVPSLAT